MRFGYLRSPPHKVGKGHPIHVLSAVVSLPREAAVELAPVLNQEDQDCTAHAGALAIQSQMRRAPDGGWYPLPSRRALYAESRAIAGIALTEDAGSYIWSTFDAMQRLGFCSESAWPYTGDNLTRFPDWEALRESIDQRVLQGAYRITSTGSERERDAATAIAAGKVVTWGTVLDQQFVDLGPGDVWPGLVGREIGGHAMVLNAYRTASNGSREFLTRSSWGADWCDGGSAWVSSEALSSDNADDFWIVDVSVPRYSEVV